MPTWRVVKFLKDQTVEAVPNSWVLENKMCYWPPTSFTREGLLLALKNHTAPTEDWPIYKVFHYNNNCFDSYDLARMKVTKAKKNYIVDLASDSDTTAKKNRKLHKKKIISSDDEDSRDGSCDTPPTTLNNAPKLKKGPLQKVPNSSRESCSSESEVMSTAVDEYFRNEDPTDELIGPNKLSSCSNVTRNNLNQDQPITPTNKGRKSVAVDKGFPNDRTSTRKECMGTSSTRDLEGCACIKLQKEILRQQHLLKGMMSDLFEEIRTIKSQQVENNPPTSSIFVEVHLPANTHPELADLEEYLKIDEKFQSTVKEMSIIGGRNIYDFIKRVISRFVTDSLASHYSYCGLRNKDSFSKLTTCQMVIESAKRSPDFQQITVKEIEECLKKWLRRAKERSTSKKNIN
uniref:DUF4806 domain-containing protein n=2 Tax=Photinus pyralis TaxID=7054 RepID=A0A1Y1K0U2_PHOPY